MILAGDVGGTKTLLAFFKEEGPARALKLRRFATKDFKSLSSLIKAYLSEVKIVPKTISLAVAGPVVRGQVNMVNVGWRFSVSSLAKSLGIKQVFLLNDLEATALAVFFLKNRYLRTIKPGKPDPMGNIAVIAAGTGLGEALLIRKHASFPIPVATEGGHVDFAPWDELTWEIYQFLAKKFGHVSVERVASGLGIEQIYRFLCEKEGVSPRFNKASEIGPAGLSGEDLLSEKTLEIFFKAYGREAGNLALKCLATGGVFVAGGIAPKLEPFFERGLFQEAFLDKGRLKETLSNIPIYLVTHPYPALLGAAKFARRFTAKKQHTTKK
ncbi:glucokinase [Thermodesulfatator atlanticus]|uniref:glucokinase n=1 Tax=Thermodesulfatator atlanticus TaxID=501497 RepID=UPI0003B3B566|nr:glucokinase [Thermodesulfatator atlanticus]